MDFVPITPQDKAQMLRTIGVASVETLLEGQIPSGVPRANLRLPEGLSESELIRHVRKLAARNETVESRVCFLGGGAYDHLIPSVVRYIASRGEFLTAYTPYQAEASQGTLQAMYEYQSLLCDLTGMEVANASLYEGASALAEGCVLALRETGRKMLLLSETVHPEYRQTVRTYLGGTATQIQQLPQQEGVSHLEAARSAVTSDTAALVVQVPNAFGCLEPMEELCALAHERGALFIVVVNPIALGLLKAPGEYGADVVVGEGQPLGTELSYGGPYLGLFACRQTLMRKMPGRIVGMTQDAHGRRGFVLTLQAREQHIRRSKATSNICTNEAMMALAAAVYLSAYGKEGFRDLARQNLLKAHFCRERLLKVPGIKPLFEEPFFNEFALELPTDPEKLNVRLLQEGYLGGFPLKRWDSDLANGWLVAVTEARTREEIEGFTEAVQKALS